jgi:hypothetical protein
MPSELVARQRAVYESYADRPGGFGEDQTIASTDPAEVAAQLAAAMEEVGADALNLRVQLPGMAPREVRAQIATVGTTVVELLKKTWSSLAQDG